VKEKEGVRLWLGKEEKRWYLYNLLKRKGGEKTSGWVCFAKKQQSLKSLWPLSRLPRVVRVREKKGEGCSITDRGEIRGGASGLNVERRVK